MDTIDTAELDQLLGRFVTDLGATVAAVAHAAGFRTFQRVAQTPFNLVYEARP